MKHPGCEILGTAYTFFTPGGVPPSVVRPRLHGAVCHCQTQTTSWFEAKMARQLFNVANIKYRCMSNGGHSVRPVNRIRKFIESSTRIPEKFSLIWCLADKFSPHISAYQLAVVDWWQTKILWKTSDLKWIFGVISKGLYNNGNFWKRLSMNLFFAWFTWATTGFWCVDWRLGRWVEEAEWIRLHIWMVFLSLKV